MRKHNRLAALSLTIALAVLAGILSGATWAQTGKAAPLPSREVPLPPIPHPPGDIPDTQVFVEYRSPLGFSLKVPEGWSRRVASDGVSFTTTYGGVAVRVESVSERPTLDSVKRVQIPALERAVAAVRVSAITEVRLPAGPAVRIAFGSNSAPNPVTGKAIRLENEQYLIWNNGKLATLTLHAPYGADNADQWRMMAESFRWQ